MRGLAEYHNLPIERVRAVAPILRLRQEDFLIRFRELVTFGVQFGLDVRTLAEFVAKNTSGVEPWVPPREPYEPAWEALVAGDLNAAETQATQLLDATGSRSDRWNEGNLIHHAHLILGHVRLRQGDMTGAEEHLLAAGRTPGSAMASVEWLGEDDENVNGVRIHYVCPKYAHGCCG